MKNREIFRDIPGYENLYQASTFGRIKSLKRFQKWKDKFVPIKEKILSPGLNKSTGYLIIVLSKNTKKRSYEVHRLILLTFKGKYPENMQSCHNDGDKLNNFNSNLRYDTPKNNQADRKLHGTFGKGEKNAYSKLTEKQVLKIKKLLTSKEYYQWEIAKMFNIHQATVSYINVGKTWGWVK